LNPTAIAQRHTFSDAPIPRGVPFDPAAPSKICLEYRTAWPAVANSEGASAAMVEVERHHPQFAFSAGFGPVTVAQVDAESQLRRLDQPLTRCQPVLADDAPLFTVVDAIMAAEWATFGAEGTIAATPFGSAVSDFYLTNPICRASNTMAECSALHNGGAEKATGTHG
jgi:hypothetical protein